MFRVQSSDDARRTIAGPSRSTIGASVRSGAYNRSACSVTFKGLSKSSTAIYKPSRERTEPTLRRASSSNSVRFRRQPSAKALCQPTCKTNENDRLELENTSTRDRYFVRVAIRRKESERNVSRTVRCVKEIHRNVSLILPRNNASDRKITRKLRRSESDKDEAKSAPKKNDRDRNVDRSESNSEQSERSVAPSTSRTKESERNVARCACRTRESERNIFQCASSTKENDRNVARSTSKTRARDKNDARLSCKKRENDRNVERSVSSSEQSDRSVAPSTFRTKESERNIARSACRTRESERNIIQCASATKENDRNVARSTSKTRTSDKNDARLSCKRRENDRNVERSVSNSEQSDRSVARSTSRTKESERNVARSACRTRESERNIIQCASSTKENDRNVARSTSKTRTSDKNDARLSCKKRENDRNVDRSGSFSRRNDQTSAFQTKDVARSTSKTRDITRSASKITHKDENVAPSPSKIRDSEHNALRISDKAKAIDIFPCDAILSIPRKGSRPSHSGAHLGITTASKSEKTLRNSAQSLTKQKTRRQSSASPVMSASTSSGVHLLPPLTGNSDRPKDKSRHSLKPGGILCSLKKLSSIAFGKKVVVNSALNSRNGSIVRIKRENEEDSACTTLQVDDTSQSTAQITWSDKTPPKPTEDYSDAQMSQQQCIQEQSHSAIPPDQRNSLHVKLRTVESPANLPKDEATRQDIPAFEISIECTEESGTTQKYPNVPRGSMDLPGQVPGEQDSVFNAEASTDKTKDKSSEPQKVCANVTTSMENQGELKIESTVTPAKKQKDSEHASKLSPKKIGTILKKTSSLLEHSGSSSVSLQKEESIPRKTSSLSEHPCSSSVSLQMKESIPRKTSSLSEHPGSLSVSFQKEESIPRKTSLLEHSGSSSVSLQKEESIPRKTSSLSEHPGSSSVSLQKEESIPRKTSSLLEHPGSSSVSFQKKESIPRKTSSLSEHPGSLSVSFQKEESIPRKTSSLLEHPGSSSVSLQKKESIPSKTSSLLEHPGSLSVSFQKEESIPRKTSSFLEHPGSLSVSFQKEESIPRKTSSLLEHPGSSSVSLQKEESIPRKTSSLLEHPGSSSVSLQKKESIPRKTSSLSEHPGSLSVSFQKEESIPRKTSSLLEHPGSSSVSLQKKESIPSKTSSLLEHPGSLSVSFQKEESIPRKTSSLSEHPCSSSVSLQKKESISEKDGQRTVEATPSESDQTSEQGDSSASRFTSECIPEHSKREDSGARIALPEAPLKPQPSKGKAQTLHQSGLKDDIQSEAGPVIGPIEATTEHVCAEITTTSGSPSGVPQCQMMAVREGKDISDATEVALKPINRVVSKPPPTELTCYPGEPSRTFSNTIVSEQKTAKTPPCQEQLTISPVTPKPSQASSLGPERSSMGKSSQASSFGNEKTSEAKPSQASSFGTERSSVAKPSQASFGTERSSEAKPSQASFGTERSSVASDDAVWTVLKHMPRVEDCDSIKSQHTSNGWSNSTNLRPNENESPTVGSGEEENGQPKTDACKPKARAESLELFPEEDEDVPEQLTGKETRTKRTADSQDRKECKHGEPSKSSKHLDSDKDFRKAFTAKCMPRHDREIKLSGEERRQTPPSVPTSYTRRVAYKPPCDKTEVCPLRRFSIEDSTESFSSVEKVETNPAEEGSAARCEPILKLKLKKNFKEPMQSDVRDIQEDIRIWKDLYAGCLERLRSLQQMNQSPVRHFGRPDKAPESGYDKPLRRTSNNSQCAVNIVKSGMDEAVRVLESEFGLVENSLRKHSMVLSELVSVLQNRLNAQPEAMRAAELSELGLGTMKDVKDSIHYLKALITENETLTMQLAAERAKQQVLRQVQVTNDVVDEPITATEDKLHRTNSLLKMQMKRLQYEISRLTEAQNIEIKAGSILVQQAQADVENDREALESLQESNERLHELLSSKRFVSGQRVFKRASRGSFLSDDQIGNSYSAFRREQLECRIVISDRVQRNLELSNDEITFLENLGRKMCLQISETNEEIRKNEFAWLQLRKERDELTKDLYPDLERLQLMQDVSKEKLDLESKLRKENMLFRHQLEEFQKDLLEVETELMSGVITRRTEATKNKVLELETLFENAKLHNAKLRDECDAKHLTISRHDSLASLSIDEEEFQRQISEKIQRMELRIQADMDRRLLRPKRYVLEAPGKAKVSFRGQRNVIRAPKNVAEWRRKREVPSHAVEPPMPAQPKDAQDLRREILAKLAEEKERAKEQLLRYEAHHIRQTSDAAEPSARELNELLGRLGRFLNQTRGQETSEAVPSSSARAPQGAPEAQSLHGGEFGETLMHLIVQLDQLQSALTGEDGRRRVTVRPTVTAERHRELLDKLPDASKRGSENGNGTRGITPTTTSTANTAPGAATSTSAMATINNNNSSNQNIRTGGSSNNNTSNSNNNTDNNNNNNSSNTNPNP